MEYDDPEMLKLRDEFATRRKRQLLATVPILALIVVVAISDRNNNGQLLGVGPTLWGPIALVGVLGFIVFTLKNWRCPACDRYLGKGISPRYCAKCGVQLSA